MSCVGFLSPEQRAALAASVARASLADVLAAHPVPPVTDGTLRRIRLLATDSRPGIRASAALHPHAPQDVLVALAGDDDVGVRSAVARNVITGPALLRKLAADREAAVRGWVAAHRSTPAEVLDALAGDDDPTVARVVQWNRAWPEVSQT